VSTIFRAVFEDDRPDLLVAGRSLFAAWLSQKDIDGEVPVEGVTELAPGKLVTAVAAEELAVSALRLRLDEETPPQRWTTVLTLIQGSHGQWVWIDLERVSDDMYGVPPTLAPPRLVADFIASGTARVGPTRLRAESVIIDETGVDDLVRELISPDRTIPVVVVSVDTSDATAAERRARALSRTLQGLATVWALTGTATSALSKALGPDLHVYGGAVRTYYPGLTIPDRYPNRHRFARRELFAEPRQGAQIVGRAIIAKAVAMRPPPVYREVVSAMPGFARRSQDAEAILADLVSVEADRDRLQEDLELQQLELAEETQRGNDAEARVRWLTAQLESVGTYVAGELTPEAERQAIVTGCADALARGEMNYDGLVFGDTGEAAAELDQHPKAGLWGRKADQAFQALDGYARAKRSGAFAGSFLGYCQSPPDGAPTIPADWVVLVESEGIGNNPAYRSPRTFPVPASVDPSGQVYMQTHIRLEKGSDPAPRIHLYDDTGRGGAVYVGYLGRHLLSPKTT
jgi:hypothetical protein